MATIEEHLDFARRLNAEGESEAIKAARAEGWNAAVEACAKIADKETADDDWSCMASEVAGDIAESIRALSTAKADAAKANSRGISVASRLNPNPDPLAE